MTTARIARGRKTQRILADYLREHGWPHAESVVGAMTGRDIRGVPGMAIEVKATSGGLLLPALRQAKAYAAGDIPIVVWRPNGYGPERIQEWVFAMSLEQGIALMKAAGHGRA